MFTGIVQELGTVAAVTRGREVDRLTVQAFKTAAGLQVGESVAVNGVCLSAVRVRDGSLTFETVPETRRLTTLGALAVGERVNLERSLSLSDRLNGHLVLGHVDGIGRVMRRRTRAGEVALDIRVDRSLRRYLVPKGPVTVDGVSLTLGAALSPGGFSIFLIPETLRKTTLHLRAAGDSVNLEVDYIAKLILQQPRQQKPYALEQLLEGVTKRNRHAAIE